MMRLATDPVVIPHSTDMLRGTGNGPLSCTTVAPNPCLQAESRYVRIIQEAGK